LDGAENIYLGQIQSETPYFQAGQLTADLPYSPTVLIGSPNKDPTFEHCGPQQGTAATPDTCREAWAIRILNSAHIYLYGGGFYSFFKDYKDRCSKEGNVCQDRLIDLSHSEEIWIYSIYTVGATEIISPQGAYYESLDRQKFTNGFATSLTAWLHLAGPDKKHIGGTRGRRGFQERSPDSTCADIGTFEKTHPKCQASKKDNETTDNDTAVISGEPIVLFDQKIEAFEASGARDVWCEIMEILRNIERDRGYFGSTSMNPSRAVAQKFHYPGQALFSCRGISDVGCEGMVPCPAGNMVWEAQRLILQSFVGLNRVSKSRFHVNDDKKF
jgi:hypothetical protein